MGLGALPEDGLLALGVGVLEELARRVEGSVDKGELGDGFDRLAHRARPRAEEVGVLRVAVEAQHLELLAA